MGKVSIVEGGEDVTITLNANSADISAGGNGENGTIVLKDNQGQEIVRLGRFSTSPKLAPYNGIMLKDSGGKVRISLNASAGDVIVGGNGKDGNLIIRDKEGNQVAEILVGLIRLSSPDGKQRFFVDQLGANLVIGGNGADGDISILPANSPAGILGKLNKPTIKLTGNNGQIWLYNKDGNDSIVIDPLYANLRLGGRDKGGDIVLYPKGFGLMPDDLPNKPFIHLNGEDSTIVLRKKVASDIDYEIVDSIVLDGKQGDIFLKNADCAEEFDISERDEIEPGMVMVLDQEGRLQQSRDAYDKKVAGVISGAGDYKPGIILDKQSPQTNRLPIALVGKAYCKVDAQYSPIEVGDLLTTSPTPGHAMKASDPLKAFGAVIGKALRPLEAEQGLIPILIALQ